MKGTGFTLFVSLLSFATFIPQGGAQVVLNEANLVLGPNMGQFVELYGIPNTPLDGHALVVVKSASMGGGVWSAQTQAVVDLDGMSLDADGFAAALGGNDPEIIRTLAREVKAQHLAPTT